MARCRRFIFLLIGVVTCLVVGLQVWLDGASLQIPNHRKQPDVLRLGLLGPNEANILNSTTQKNPSLASHHKSNITWSTTNEQSNGEKLASTATGPWIRHTTRRPSKPKKSSPYPKKGQPSGGGILSPEQMLRILGNTIAALPVIPPAKVIRVLIVTYFRSGSTFMGDVFQQNWKTFYHFEPLHYMSDGLRIKPNQTEEALTLLRDIFNCNFTAPLAPKYLKWAEDQRHTFLFKRNRFLWVACRMQPKTCFRPDFANYVCQRAPIQVMKVTRLHLDHVLTLVRENPELDIRVVHLIRDPRGIISSRKVLDWCNTTSCSDFRVLCNEMNADYDAFQKMKTLPAPGERYFRVRYEDLALRPESVVKNLFASVGLPYTSSVVKFLRINTRARAKDSKDPYSTRRDSSKTAFEWRRKIPLPEIKKVQIGCSRVLKNYQYGFVNNPSHLKGDPPLLPFKN